MSAGSQPFGWLPKVELHVHLDGAFDEGVLWEALDVDALPLDVGLAWEPGKRLPIRERVRACRSRADYHALVTCKGQRSLACMFNCFEVFLPTVRGDLRLIERLAEAFVDRQAASNVMLTEVRYSPHLLAPGGSYNGEGAPPEVDPVPVVDAVTRGLRAGCARHPGVVVNQLLCCISFRPEFAHSVVALADARRGDFPCAVVGIDLAAGEGALNPAQDANSHATHMAAFRRARELGINCTVHAGEEGDPANVQTAIRDFGARRIGHGYAIAEHAELLRECATARVHFEACPTSSYETGLWAGSSADTADWARHPIRAFHSAGIPFSLSTDDPAVFDTSLGAELELVRERIGLSEADLVESTLRSIDAAFGVAPDEREAMKARVRSSVAAHSESDSLTGGQRCQQQ